MQSGAFIARVGPPGTAKGLDLRQPIHDQRNAVAGPWRIAWQAGIVIWARNLRDWPMPFVATVAGIAVLGAHITSAQTARTHDSQTQDSQTQHSQSGRRTEPIHLTLEEPGDWYAEIHLRRMPIPPRGTPWTMIPAGKLLAPDFGPNAQGARLPPDG